MLKDEGIRVGADALVDSVVDNFGTHDRKIDVNGVKAYLDKSIVTTEDLIKENQLLKKELNAFTPGKFSVRFPFEV